jgi:transposase
MPANQGGRDRAANKIARMAWAMMRKGERYREPAALAA